MQTAATLPFFLLAFPAGALADVLDRRRLLLATQTWMTLAAAALGVLTLAGMTTPPLLLGLTFALGIGAAMTAPAWQAMTPELVPRADLPAAIALNAVAFNLARAVGPAAGGLTTASIGPGAVFLVNAASFLGVLLVLARWRRPPVPTFDVPENVFGAMRAGARYVRHSLPLRSVLARSAAFVVFASAVWSLLPLVARQLLGLGPVGYGLLLGCLGLGAVLGAAALARLREHFVTDRLMAAATLLFALASATLGAIHDPILAGIVLVGGGMAWLAVMSSINVAAQTAVSGWVRARALAVSLLVIQGSMAGGALLWGWVASRIGVSNALLVAAGTGSSAAWSWRAAFRSARPRASTCHRPSRFPRPSRSATSPPATGRCWSPSSISSTRRAPTTSSTPSARMARIRRRDGAQLWGVFRDAVDPARWLETFTVESWAEHLRQHERVTVSDRELQDVARSFHVGPTRPVVTHYIAAPPRRGVSHRRRRPAHATPARAAPARPRHRPPRRRAVTIGDHLARSPAAMRAPGTTMPTRLSGSAAATTTVSSPADRRRKARSALDGLGQRELLADHARRRSGRRAPRRAPRACGARGRSSRHGGMRGSRASSSRSTTPQRRSSSRAKRSASAARRRRGRRRAAAPSGRPARAARAAAAQHAQPARARAVVGLVDERAQPGDAVAGDEPARDERPERVLDRRRQRARVATRDVGDERGAAPREVLEHRRRVARERRPARPPAASSDGRSLAQHERERRGAIRRARRRGPRTSSRPRRRRAQSAPGDAPARQRCSRSSGS